MWILSGAFFPASGVPGWLGWAMIVNPMTYGLAAIRRCLYLDAPEAAGGVPGLMVGLTVSVLFAIATLVAAVTVARRKEV
jgi:ABC-type polysaccharide/polyol phosphate export permease